MTELSIVLPCYHPALGWDEVVMAHYQELSAQLPEPPQLVLVCDGDQQMVFSYIEKIRKAIPKFSFVGYDENRGKGFALREGVNLAKGKYIIYTDIDFPYGMKSVLNVYKELKAGANVVAGIKQAAYYESVPALRRVISKSFRWSIRTFFRMPITDTQCGLKGFDEKGKTVFQKTSIDRYLFDLEFIYMATRRNDLRCVAVPATLRPGISFRSMDLRILATESSNFLKILWRKK